MIFAVSFSMQMLAFLEKWCYDRGEFNIVTRVRVGRTTHSYLRKKVVFVAAGRRIAMSKRETYEQRTEELIAPIIAQNQFELVDVEYVKEGGTWYLRAYIDKPGGITVDDCEVVSRALSDLLDKNDFIEDAYVLEVSSPGLGRPLKKEKDFARSIGEEVEVRTFRAISHQKEFTGILQSYDKEKIILEMEDQEPMEIPRADIALIRLAFDF